MVSSWLGVVLLAANIVGAGLLPVRAAEAGPAPFAQDIVADHIVVCTAAGMVVMDRDGHVIPNTDSGGHADFCVFCLPLMHAGVQAAPAVAVVATVLPAVVPAAAAVPTASSRPKPARPVGASPPRAPPSLLDL